MQEHQVKTKPPAPETKRVMLSSAAYEREGHPPVVTRHKYVGTRACILAGPGGGPAWEFLFQCSESGFTRRYGAVDRTTVEAIDSAPSDLGGN